MAFDLSTWATAKYRYTFVGDEGTSYVAEIHEDGFSGSVSAIDVAGRASISTRWASEGDNEFAAFMTSETSLSLYDTGEALADDLIDALDTVDNKYVMVIRSGNDLKWVGRIDPESINFDEDGPVTLSVTATDGLGRLENKPYISSTDGSGVDEGSATLVSIIADVLSDTGFGLDFYISSSLVPRAATAINATQNPLQYVWVNKIAFTSNRDKEERGLVSKLSVLEAICKAWGLRIFQSDGAWHLIQVSHFSQNSHRKWQYNSSGTLQGYADVDPRITIANEDVTRTRSTADILPGYKSAVVQYQHGPIRILRFPQFEPLSISDAEAIFGGDYPWSQYVYTPPNPAGVATLYTFDDGSWGMGVDEINVTGGLSGKAGYVGIEIDDKGVIFANIPHTTLTTYIGNGFSEQTTDPIPSGIDFKFGANLFGLQHGTNPNPNPHLVADEWVAFKIRHDGTTTRYLKFGADGSLDWSTDNNWCLIRNGLQASGWSSLDLTEIESTVNDGTITVTLGPVIYDDADEALWQKVIWDNVQLFPKLADGQTNYDASTAVLYINNSARSEPRPVQRTVVIGDGPSTFNKGSMFTNSGLTVVTQDWEITTTGHSGSNTDISHAQILGELMLRCMNKIRRKHNASYIGYGGVLTPLNVLNRNSTLWSPWEITTSWQGEYSQGSWYRAEYTSSLSNLETEAGIATGSHLLSDFGRGTSANSGFTYNRIGSSFDTLIARENDRISKVTANASSGTTVSCEALADPAGNSLVLRHNDSVYFQSVKTGRIIKRLVDASGNSPAYSPYAAGATTFEVSDAFTADEKIETGDPILPGTITGMRIDLDGVSIINTHIKSEGTYAFNGTINELTGAIDDPGSTGWVISKSGEAVFNDIIARGKIDVAGIRIGKDVGYLTGIGDEPTAGEHGIWINSDNYWILDTNADPDKEFFRVGDANSHINWDGTTGSEAFTIKSQGNIVFDSSSGINGLGLDGDLEIVDGRIVIGSTPDVVLDSDGLVLSTGSGNVNKVRWTTGGVSPTYSEIYTAGPGVMVLNPLTDLSITADSVKINPGVARFVGTSDSGEAGWVTMYANTSGYFFRRNGTGTDHRIVDNELLPVATGANGDILYYNSGWQKLAKGSDGQVLTLASGLPSWATGGGGGGSATFTGLTDTPSSFTGSGSQLVRVNSGATALEFVDGSTLYQPLDSDLTAIAGLSPTTGQIIYAYAGSWTSLPIGSAGTFLKSSFGTPSWTSIVEADISNLGTTIVLNSDIGSTVQAYDADLSAIAGLSNADGNFIVGNGSAWTVESGATARASLGLSIGTDVQAWDLGLDNIAALTPTTGQIIFAQSGSWTSLPIGTAGTFLKSSFGTPSWTSIVEADISNLGTTIVLDSDIGSTVQAYDSDLTQIASLSPTTGQIIYANAGSWNMLPIGTAGTFIKSTFGSPSWASIAASDILSGTFADARIAESSVTQHEAALSITESQISDLGSYITNQKGVANLYSRYGQITVNSTTAVDFLGNSGSYVGTSTVPANSVLQGSIFRIVARGTRQGNASDSHTYTLKLGTTTLLTYTYTPANTFGGYDGWKFEAIVSVSTTGSSGTVWAQGQFHNANNIYMFENTATDSYNTTTATDISLEVSTNTNTTATCEVAYIDVSRSSSVV